MGAAAGFDRGDPFGRQRLVPDQKLRVFTCKNVVRHRGNGVLIAQFAAQGQHQRRLATADGTSNSHSEGPAGVVALPKRFGPLLEQSRMLHPRMRMAVLAMCVAVVVRMIVIMSMGVRVAMVVRVSVLMRMAGGHKRLVG